MLVETKSASLNTMAVTIQALHVEGKQMTLAVFRQLPKMTIDIDCQIWGIVCYSIPNEGEEWLVFSWQNKLFKQKLVNEIPQEYILTNRGYKKNNSYNFELMEYNFYTEIEEIYPQLFIAV
jgi:hypothetical protein